MSEPLRHFIDRAQRVGHMPLDTRNGSHEALLQAAGAMPFWSRCQTCFVIAGFH